MRKGAWIVAAVALAAGALLGAQVSKTATYVDHRYGFAIEAPDFPGSGTTPVVMPLAMSGPAKDGFSSNVNVMVQRVKTTRDAYRRQTHGQFKAAGFTVNEDRDVRVSGKNALWFDYEGQRQGKALRWLALTVIDTDRVLLITCTCPKSRFDAHKATFTKCLESFRLLGGEGAAE